jgi:polyisoprenoid-binding protein YceI
MGEVNSLSRIYHGNLLPVAGKYVFDPVHSFAEFATQHVVVGQVWGRFDTISGEIEIHDDPLISAVNVSIDSASLSTHKKERDEDLRSARFFDVIKYPVITFRSTDIKVEPEGEFSVTGNMTIKAVTRPLSLSVDFRGIANDPWGNTRAAFLAKGKLNRRDYDLFADLERDGGGFLVGQDVELRVITEAIYKK